MVIENQEIAYRDGDTPLNGLLYTNSAKTGKGPGLLLVHHAYGLDEHTREHAAAHAEAGFVVFACDMYGSEVAGNRERMTALLMEMRANPAKLVSRGRAGLAVLAAHPLFDGRLAAIGYCFGGMTVLQMARSGVDFVGAVSVHGSLATVEPAAADAIKAKILVCHGALDPHVPMAQVAAFIEEMKQARADWQLIIYGDAMHGFTSKVASVNPGVAYNAAADARSTTAIQNFFAELFGKPILATPDESDCTR
jgi:dienelactone hydrolase